MAPSYSLNTILSTEKENKKYSVLLWQNSIFLVCILVSGAIGFSLLILNFFPHYFVKYNFNEYAFLLFLIFGLTSLNHLFVNLYRSYGLLKKINFFELIIPLFQLVILFTATEKKLLYFLLLGTILGNCISLILFVNRPPLKIGITYTKNIFRKLFLRGFHLLLFNISFSLILISSRTIVSFFYAPEELGFYTFAVNLSNAVFMIVGAFGFILYPKLLNKFHSNNNIETKQLLKKIRSLYITGCFLLTFLGFCSIPFLEFFLPNYISAITVFKILLVTQLILNNTFGYNILLISKGKEKLMTINALWSISLIIGISLIFVYFNLSFSFIAIAVSFGFIFYCLRITSQALSEVGGDGRFMNVIAQILPYYYLFPIALLILSIIINDDYYLPLISCITFLVLNLKKVRSVKNKLRYLILDNNSLKF